MAPLNPTSLPVSGERCNIHTGVTKMYEARLKEVNPFQGHITYDITELYGFIDELGDLSALV